MVTFKIVHNSFEFPDEIIISGETIDECREVAKNEMSKRGWKPNNCYSIKIDE